MSGYRWLTGRNRRVRLYGTYSYNYRLVVDLLQTGLHAKVGRVYAGSSGSPGPFLGWALPIQLQRRSLCFAGLDQNYTNGISSTPTKSRKGFGPLYTHSGSTTACVIQVRDQASGTVLVSFDAGWDGVTGYYAGDPGINQIAPQIVGWIGGDVSGLYTSGSVLTVTDTYEGTYSDDYEFVMDRKEVEWRRYTGYYSNELEPAGAGGMPTDRVEFSEIGDTAGVMGWIAGGSDETLPILNPDIPPIDADIFWPWCILNCQGANGQTATASLTTTWDGGGYLQTPTAMSASHADGSISESSVSATAVGTAARRSFSQSFFPVKWRYIGRADCVAFGSSIPESGEVQFPLAGGGTLTVSGSFPIVRGTSGEFGFSYRRGQGRAGFQPAAPTTTGTPTSHFSGSVTTLPPSLFTCQLSNASFAALEVEQQRFSVRGPGWDQFSLYQEQYRYYAKDPWHTIQSGAYSAKGWYPGLTAAITAISVVSGKLRIETSGTGGSETDRAAVLKLLDYRVEMRHVGIRIRSVGAANLPFRLILGHDAFDPITGEEFDSTTGADGVWVERMFDRYDYHEPSLDYTGIVPDDTLNQVAVANLDISSTYEIEWIRGERMGHSKVYVGTSFQLITDTLLTRIETLKQNGDELSTLLIPNGTDTGDNPSSWVMTDLAPEPMGMVADPYDTILPATTTYLDPDFHRNSTVALYPWLEGMGFRGLFVDAPADGMANQKTLRAYPLAVAVTAYPGAGDVFGQGDFGEDIECDFDMVVRGQAFGPILGPGASSQEVVLTELTPAGADNGERGRGSADGDGYYRTGPPYARHLGNFEPWVRAWLDDQFPTTPLTNKVADGTRWWILWRTTGEEVRWPSADINRMMRAVRTYLNDSDEVVIGFINSPLATSWENFTTSIVADHPCVRYGRGVSDGRILLVYEDGSAVVRRETTDEGRSWTMATTIFAAGEKPTLAVTPTGVEHHFAQDGAGAILTRILDPQGTEIEAETTVVASGAADDAMYAFERDGYIYLGYKDTSGAVVTIRSLDGVTFS